MAQPATVKEPPRLVPSLAQKLSQQVELVFEHADAEVKRQMMRDCVNAVTLNHEELRVHVTYSMPAAILSTTDPGAIAEVCGHSCGSGGTR